MRPTIVMFALLLAVPVMGAQTHTHSATPPTPAAARQIEQVRKAAASFSTPDRARAAGYEPALGWIPMMGTHWVHGPRMLKGKDAVTLTEPSQLMFSPVDGKETLVGVAYAY